MTDMQNTNCAYIHAVYEDSLYIYVMNFFLSVWIRLFWWQTVPVFIFHEVIQSLRLRT